MDYKQEGIEKMSNTAMLFMQNNASTLTLIPGITTFLTTIEATNTSIASAKVQQLAGKRVGTCIKKQQRGMLITQGTDIASRLVAMSINTNNVTLQGLVDYTKTDLVKSTDSNLMSICQVICDNANVNLKLLAPYGVAPAAVATLQGSINNFSAAISKARVDTTGNSEITRQLSLYFDTLKATWKKVDKLVEIVRVSHPAFYSEYRNVRRVIMRGSNPHALRVQTVSAQTGQPEPNVIITLTPVKNALKNRTNKNKIVVSKKTAKGGGAFFRSIPDGTYHVAATKLGFQESVMTIAIVRGEYTSHTIPLQAIQSYGTA